jgi:hypothetical protein
MRGNGPDCRDLPGLPPLGSEENDAGSFGTPDLGPAAVGPRLQGGSLFSGEFDRRSNAQESPAPQRQRRRRAHAGYQQRSTTLEMQALAIVWSQKGLPGCLAARG